MGTIYHFFSINNVFFTLWDYPMSYIEFFGTILNIWCVWLVAKRKILTWPVGIVAVVLFMLLFYQIRLYSDFIEQIYFLITGFYGWWLWSKKGKNEEKADKDDDISVKNNSYKENIIWGAGILFATVLMGFFMKNIHIYFPKAFPEAASFPMLDAFTTVMSFAAQFLMAHRKVECWVLWISVDIIGIWLYFVKEVRFVSLLYLIFLILASKGLIEWYLIWKKEKRKKIS